MAKRDSDRTDNEQGDEVDSTQLRPLGIDKTVSDSEATDNSDAGCSDDWLILESGTAEGSLRTDTTHFDVTQTKSDRSSEDQAGFDLAIPQMIGKYEVRRMLGQGGVGTVYLAYDPLIEREVAIKVLRSGLAEDSTVLKRFLREARAVGQLKHPNAIAIYEVGENDGEYFIVMEFVEGGTVLDLVRENRFLPLAEACRITIEAARGLEAAHKRGLIHRDVKPENVMLSADGVVKLVDFGLAKLVDRGSELSLTATGQTMGTPVYMSPEQIRSETPDARTDIYSLGATFFQLLTGRPPFVGNTVAQLVYAHLEADRPDPAKLKPELPTRCSDIIATAMAVKPEDRYASISEMISDIQALAVTDSDAASHLDCTGPRVVIVESSKLASTVIADVFRKAGCNQVHCCQLAGEAISQIATTTPDVVITARQLPDAQGEDLLKQIRPSSDADHPMCVLLSAEPPLEVFAQSKLGGASAVARKQSPDEILRAVVGCTDCMFPRSLESPTRDTHREVAIISKDGTVPPDLSQWLQDLGIVAEVVPASKPAEHTTEVNSGGLIVCLNPAAVSRDDLIRCLQGPVQQMIGHRTTVAIVDDQRRLRGVARQSFVGICDRPFDRDRLERLLK